MLNINHQTMNTLIDALSGVALTLGLVCLIVVLAVVYVVYSPTPERRKR
jgi:hypothetical protein